MAWSALCSIVSCADHVGIHGVVVIRRYGGFQSAQCVSWVGSARRLPDDSEGWHPIRAGRPGDGNGTRDFDRMNRMDRINRGRADLGGGGGVVFL